MFTLSARKLLKLFGNHRPRLLEGMRIKHAVAVVTKHAVA